MSTLKATRALSKSRDRIAISGNPNKMSSPWPQSGNRITANESRFFRRKKNLKFLFPFPPLSLLFFSYLLTLTSSPHGIFPFGLECKKDSTYEHNLKDRLLNL